MMEPHEVVIRLIKVVIVMRICQVVATPPEVVGASTSAAVQSKSVETKNEDVISKGCVKLAVARFGEVLL